MPCGTHGTPASDDCTNIGRTYIRRMDCLDGNISIRPISPIYCQIYGCWRCSESPSECVIGSREQVSSAPSNVRSTGNGSTTCDPRPERFPDIFIAFSPAF